MVYSDFDFRYLHEEATGANYLTDPFVRAGNEYVNSYKALLANTVAELSMSYSTRMGHTDIIFGLYTRGEVTLDAFKSGAAQRAISNAPGQFAMTRFESGLSIQLELRK